MIKASWIIELFYQSKVYFQELKKGFKKWGLSVSGDSISWGFSVGITPEAAASIKKGRVCRFIKPQWKEAFKYIFKSLIWTSWSPSKRWALRDIFIIFYYCLVASSLSAHKMIKGLGEESDSSYGFLRAGPGCGSDGVPWGGSQHPAAADGSGLLHFHSEGGATAWLVLVRLSWSSEPVSALSEGKHIIIPSFFSWSFVLEAKWLNLSSFFIVFPGVSTLARVVRPIRRASAQ